MATAEPSTADTPTPAPRRPLFQRLVSHGGFWGALIAGIAAVTIGRSLVHRVPPAPSLSLPLPAWQLVDERGQPFGAAQLAGKVYVADFVFTTCPTVCPKLTARMVQLQERTRGLGDAFRLVTFTVDPENDTPEVLTAYARANHADPTRWSFVTGPLDQIESTVVKGFKIAMGREGDGGSIMSIFHGERLVLVDQKGTIRGYYEATDEGLPRLVADADVLINSR